MHRTGRQIAKRLLTAGILIVITFFLVSCLLNPFNQRPNPVIALVGGGLPYGVAPLALSFDFPEAMIPMGTSSCTYSTSEMEAIQLRERTCHSQSHIPMTHPAATPPS